MGNFHSLLKEQWNNCGALEGERTRNFGSKPNSCQNTEFRLQQRCSKWLCLTHRVTTDFFPPQWESTLVISRCLDPLACENCTNFLVTRDAQNQTAIARASANSVFAHSQNKDQTDLSQKPNPQTQQEFDSQKSLGRQQRFCPASLTLQIAKKTVKSEFGILTTLCTIFQCCFFISNKKWDSNKNSPLFTFKPDFIFWCTSLSVEMQKIVAINVATFNKFNLFSLQCMCSQVCKLCNQLLTNSNTLQMLSIEWKWALWVHFDVTQQNNSVFVHEKSKIPKSLKLNTFQHQKVTHCVLLKFTEKSKFLKCVCMLQHSVHQEWTGTTNGNKLKTKCIGKDCTTEIDVILNGFHLWKTGHNHLCACWVHKTCLFLSQHFVYWGFTKVPDDASCKVPF